MSINKFSKKSLLLLCAVAGIVINAIWYFIRYEAEGFPDWLAVTCGLALIIFEAILVVNKNMSKKIFLVLWGVVFFYSVISTQAGQTFYLMSKRNETVAENVSNENNTEMKSFAKSELDRYDSLIASKQKEIDNMPEDSPAWVKSQLEAEKNKLNKERTPWALKVAESISNQTTSKSVKKESIDIYEYYSFGNKAAEAIIQFILHFIASIIFAVMAPACLYIYSFKATDEKFDEIEKKKKEKKSKKDFEKQKLEEEKRLAEEKKKREHQEKIEKLKNAIDIYARIRFLKVEPGKRLNDKRFCLQMKPPLTEEQYDYITKLAIKNQVIVSSGEIHLPSNKNMTESMFVERMKELVNENKL